MPNHRRRSKTKHHYEVIVGNVGTVHRGSSRTAAIDIFNKYVEISRSGVGRAGDETIVLMEDDEISKEHIGAMDVEGSPTPGRGPGSLRQPTGYCKCEDKPWASEAIPWPKGIHNWKELYEFDPKLVPAPIRRSFAIATTRRPKSLKEMRAYIKNLAKRIKR